MVDKTKSVDFKKRKYFKSFQKPKTRTRDFGALIPMYANSASFIINILL